MRVQRKLIFNLEANRELILKKQLEPWAITEIEHQPQVGKQKDSFHSFPPQFQKKNEKQKWLSLSRVLQV